MARVVVAPVSHVSAEARFLLARAVQGERRRPPWTLLTRRERRRHEARTVSTQTGRGPLSSACPRVAVSPRTFMKRRAGRTLAAHQAKFGCLWLLSPDARCFVCLPSASPSRCCCCCLLKVGKSCVFCELGQTWVWRRVLRMSCMWPPCFPERLPCVQGLAVVVNLEIFRIVPFSSRLSVLHLLQSCFEELSAPLLWSINRPFHKKLVIRIMN